MSYVDNQGVEIYYEVVGDEGSPLVMQTGGGGDHEMWREGGYVDGLRDCRLVLLDHRGHGRSGKPLGVEAHHVDRYVADVLAVLDALSIDRAAFWGYSAGTWTGYALAAAYPDRISALVASGVISPSDRDSLEGRAAAASDAAEVRSRGLGAVIADAQAEEGMTFPRWFLRQMEETDREMFTLEVLGAAEWRGPWSLLPHITAPTLMLVGALEDPDGDNPCAAALMPHARCVTFPALGHVGAYVRSDLALAEAVPFLREVAGGRP